MMNSPDRSLTKTTDDGRTAVISRYSGIWTVEVDGRPHASGFLLPVKNPTGSITHTIGAFGLTAEDVVRLEKILAAERTAELATPAGRRRALVRERGNAIRDWTIMREYVAEGRRSTRDLAAAQATMDAAVEAVSRFDVENPGVRTHEEEEEDRRELHTLRMLRYE